MKMFWRRRQQPDQLSCHEVGKILQDYLDDELDVQAATKVSAHLEDCRRCGLEAATYAALKSSLHRVPAGPIPAEPIARLREFGERLVSGELDPGAI